MVRHGEYFGPPFIDNFVMENLDFPFKLIRDSIHDLHHSVFASGQNSGSSFPSMPLIFDWAGSRTRNTPLAPGTVLWETMSPCVIANSGRTLVGQLASLQYCCPFRNYSVRKGSQHKYMKFECLTTMKGIETVDHSTAYWAQCCGVAAGPPLFCDDRKIQSYRQP